jgi:XTP/dITP diphosphohydrolase
MSEIVIATENAGKVTEFLAFLHDLPYTFTTLQDYAITQAEETASTFIENAILKARHAASCLNKPCIADDSGLMVDALHGEPGLYSARYAGEGKDFSANIEKILGNMKDVPESKRQATFYCALVYLRSAEDRTPEVFIGINRGVITTKPIGHHSFGYSPIFYLPELGCTVAELTLAEKNQYSFRAKALQKLHSHLKNTCE